jgi:hypothetical protein
MAHGAATPFTYNEMVISMRNTIIAVAVLGIALLTMGQSCSYVPSGTPDDPLGILKPHWEGWINEGNYVWWRFSQFTDANVQAVGKVIDYNILIVPAADFERFQKGYPYRVFCARRVQDSRIAHCWPDDTGAKYTYDVYFVILVNAFPDFVSGDLYAKVWFWWPYQF